MKVNIKHILFMVPLFVLGCNKTYEEPDFELSAPEYTIDTSTKAGQRAMDFYNRTKTFLLYKNLQDRDFGWNFHMVNIYDAKIKHIKDDEIESVLDFVDQKLFAYYGDPFMTSFFPYRIILAEEVLMGTAKQNYTESEVSILLSNLNKAFTSQTAAQQLTYVRGMHNVFLNFAAKKVERNLPEFYEISDYAYSIASTSTSKPDPKELGFWTMPVKSGQTISPTRTNDMIDWVKAIAKYTPAEMQQQFFYNKKTPAGTTVRVKSEAMEKKYNVLQNELKNKYKTDLHELEPFF